MGQALAAYAAQLRDQRDELITELAGLESQLAGDLGELTAERERMQQEIRAVEAVAEAELEAALAEMTELETRA